MKLIDIIDSSAARIGRALPDGGAIYGSNLVRALERRYGFFGPQTASEFDTTHRPVRFERGMSSGAVFTLELFKDGLRAKTVAGTEAADSFLDELVQWAKEECGLQFEEADAPRIYESSIEVELKADLAHALNLFAAAGKEISKFIQSYKGPSNLYIPTGVSWWADNDPGPVPMKIERRAGEPFNKSIYFCQGPLRTVDQVSFLKKLEKSIGETTA